MAQPAPNRTLASLLASARVPPAEARRLLQHAGGGDRAWQIAHADEPVAPRVRATFEVLCARRAAGEPIAYLVGEQEFYGRAFGVGPGVLIPRPETEGLVDWAIELLAGRDQARVLDLGTGSGCIAITLALECPGLRVTATDRSEPALARAAANAVPRGAAVEFRQGDWWAAIEAGEEFDLVVSNPPYVAEGDPHLSEGDLRYEPEGALVGGIDGLDAVRAIVAGAHAHLAPGGWLVLEHGFDQARAVRELLAGAGMQGVASRRDHAGIERWTAGRQPLPAQGPVTRAPVVDAGSAGT